jgi:DnaJ-domain-containing protein 1
VELIAVIFMLIAGGAIAVFVLTAVAIAQRENGGPRPAAQGIPERDRIASSLLYQLLLLGGTPEDEALRELRRRAGLIAPVTAGIDVANWGETYARIASDAQRAWLLETAVQLIAARNTTVPLRQYSALLDLSFSLGFHTDALAKLREQYGFDYIDHAKNARPREADRAGGSTPLFVREERRDPRELLRVLEIEESPTRQLIISSYRRLAARHHPDRYHGQAEEAQSAAAARFIELTRAYEMLLSIYRD